MTTKSDAECRAAIREFCEITGKDETCAVEVLQDVDFDLEEGVVRYYSELDSGPLPDTIINEVLHGSGDESRKRTHTNDDYPKSKCAKMEDSSVQSTSIAEADQHRNGSDENEESTVSPLKKPPKAPIPSIHEIQPKINNVFTPVASSSKNHTSTTLLPTDDDVNSPVPSQLTVMSYNIDGLDERSVQARITAVLHVVAKVNPEVVFFQEVTEEQEGKLKSILGPMYNIFTGFTGQFGYYTMTAVSKNIKINSNEIIKFDRTQMGRNLLVVEAKWKDLNIKLINSHLESCWDQADTRKRQFVQAMNRMKEFTKDPNAFLLFGGDLNLRDPEVSNLPEGVQDAWVATGSNKDTKYTWDCKLNDNKELRHNNRHRFDRFFVRSPYQKMDFRLEGTQRIKGGLFPSDHFSIVCKFTKPKLP